MADKDSSDPPASANPTPGEEELDEDTKMAIALQKQMLEEFSAGGGDLGAVGMAKSLIEALSKDFSGIVAQQPSQQPGQSAPQPISSPNSSLSSPPMPHVIPPNFFGDNGEDGNPPDPSPDPPLQPQMSPPFPFQTPQPHAPSSSFLSSLSTPPPPPSQSNPFTTPPNVAPAPNPVPPLSLSGFSPVGQINLGADDSDDSDDSDDDMDLASLKQLQQTTIHSIFTKEAKVDNEEEKKPAEEGKPAEEKKKQDGNSSDDDDSDDDMDLASLKQLQQKSIHDIFTKHEAVAEKKDEEMKDSEGMKKKKEGKQEVDSPQPRQPEPSQQQQEKPKQCLICRSKITQYVVFPGCKSPHIYCVTCAQTLLTAPKPRSSSVYRPQKPHNPNKIRCAFCQLETPIDDRGIAPFKRRCRRPRGCFATGKCDIHKNEFVVYFCFDCYVAVCVHCAPEHSGHQFAVLEDAMESSKRALSQSINRLADNQVNLVNYRELIITEKKKVIESAQTRRNELVSQIAQLKKLLCTAEAKLATGVDQMEKTRLDQLSSEMKWAEDKEKLTEESIASSSALACMEEPLPFFKLLEGCENGVKDAEAVVPPKKPTPLSQFPSLPTQQIIRGLQNMSYQSGGAYNQGGSFGAFSYDYQDGEEEEEEEEEDYDYF